MGCPASSQATFYSNDTDLTIDVAGKFAFFSIYGGFRGNSATAKSTISGNIRLTNSYNVL